MVICPLLIFVVLISTRPPIKCIWILCGGSRALDLCEVRVSSGPTGKGVLTLRGASDGIVYKIMPAFRSNLSLFNKPVVISVSKDSLDVAGYTWLHSGASHLLLVSFLSDLPNSGAHDGRASYKTSGDRPKESVDAPKESAVGWGYHIMVGPGCYMITTLQLSRLYFVKMRCGIYKVGSDFFLLLLCFFCFLFF